MEYSTLLIVCLFFPSFSVMMQSIGLYSFSFDLFNTATTIDSRIHKGWNIPPFPFCGIDFTMHRVRLNVRPFALLFITADCIFRIHLIVTFCLLRQYLRGWNIPPFNLLFYFFNILFSIGQWTILHFICST